MSLLQPWAPHVTEELWAGLGHERLWEQPWPVADPSLLERDTFELVVQVNGKVRDRIEVPAGLAEDELVERAKASERVQAHLDGKEIRQTIVVPGKLVNLVVGYATRVPRSWRSRPGRDRRPGAPPGRDGGRDRARTARRAAAPAAR